MQPIQNDSFKAYKPQPQQPDPFPFVELEDHQQEKLSGGYREYLREGYGYGRGRDDSGYGRRLGGVENDISVSWSSHGELRIEHIGEDLLDHWVKEEVEGSRRRLLKRYLGKGNW